MQDAPTPSTIELGKILSTYFRLTPDIYAREHFQNYLEHSANSFDPDVSWSWLQMRFEQDAAEQENDWGSVPEGFNWESFEPNWIATVATELDYLSAFDIKWL